MLEAISDDDNQPLTLRDKIKKSANELREIGKVKYNYKGNHNIGHRELVKEVFKELLNRDVSIIEINNLFPIPNVEKKQAQFVYEEPVFNNQSFNPRNCDRFTKVTIAPKIYYLYGEWTPDKIKSLFLKPLGKSQFKDIKNQINVV